MTSRDRALFARKTLLFLLFLVQLTTLGFANDRHLKVAITVSDLGNPFFGQMAAGAKAMVEVFDPKANFIVESSNFDADLQAKQIDTFSSSGVGLILLNAVDSIKIAPAVLRAKAAGVVVIALDTGAEGADATVSFNEKSAGQIDARFVAKRLQGKGNIVIVNGPATTATTERVAGFVQEISNSPEIKIILEDQNTSGTRDGGFQVMKNALTAFPTIDAVFASNEETAIGCDLAAREAKRQDFFIVGVGGNSAIVPFLKDKDSLIAASAAKDPYLMGQEAATVGFDIRQGKKPPPDVLPISSLITTDNVSEYSNPAPTILPVPPTESDPRTRGMFYATNREPDPWIAGKLPTYSERRNFKLTFGSAVVRIPEAHSIARTASPDWIKYIASFFIRGDPQDPQKNFIFKSLNSLTKEQFLDLISKTQQEQDAQSALVYVHGFATPFQDGLNRLAQFVFDTGYPGIPILFSWPSQGKRTPPAYNYDRESAFAAYTQDALLEVIRLLQANAHFSKIYVLAHSLGNEIVLDAMNKADSSGGDKPSLSEIVLAAPDVDWDAFVYSGHSLKDLAKGVTLYVSSRDTALLMSQQVNGAKKPRAGSFRDGKPFLMEGIETIDMTALGPDIFAPSFNHDIALTTQPVLDDIGRLFFDGTRPPNHRTPTIRGVPEGSSHPTYWAFP